MASAIIIVNAFGTAGTQFSVDVDGLVLGSKVLTPTPADFTFVTDVADITQPHLVTTTVISRGEMTLSSLTINGNLQTSSGPIKLVAANSVTAPASAFATKPPTLPAAFPAKGTRGMWVWTTANILNNATEFNIFVNEVLRSGCTYVYLYLTAGQINQYTAQLRRLIRLLHDNGVLAYSMEGWRGYFSDASGPNGLYAAVSGTVSYNAKVVAEERFVGFMSDMEPQDGQGDGLNLFHNGIRQSALSTAQLADRNRLMADWLAISKHMSDIAHQGGIRMAAAMPSWTDNYYGEPVLGTMPDGRRDDVTHFFMEMLDDYAVMSYNTNPSNIANRVLGKLQYANKLPKPPRVFAGIETHTGVGSGISYGDTGTKNNKTAVVTDLNTLFGILDANPTFAGVNIHDWEGWRDLSPKASNSAPAPVLPQHSGSTPVCGWWP